MPFSQQKRASLKRRALKVYAQAGNITETARILGVDRAAIQEWRIADPAFRQAMEAIDDVTIEAVESTLVQMALDGDLHAIKFYLMHRSTRYAPRPEQHTGTPAIQQQFIVRMEQSPALPAIPDRSTRGLSSNPPLLLDIVPDEDP